jgi:hypothetical protein
MKKFLAVEAVALLVPAFYWSMVMLLAVLRHEHFYRGRPTSY